LKNGLGETIWSKSVSCQPLIAKFVSLSLLLVVILAPRLRVIGIARMVLPQALYR
jgi:hypothetical protein